MSKEISVGSYVATNCTRCRLELGHTVILMSGNKIARVKCRTCGSEHVYRYKTQRKSPAERIPSGAKREKLIRSTEKLWEAAMLKAGGEGIPYDMGRAYNKGEIILHGSFGRGIVTGTSQKKVTLLFQDKERILVSSNS